MMYGKLNCFIHKCPSIKKCSCKKSFLNELIKWFSIPLANIDSYKSSMLIYSVYNRIEKIYKNEHQIIKAWLCTKVLSQFVFSDDLFYSENAFCSLLMKMFELNNLEVFFVYKLHYSIAEYKIIKDAIILQHNNAQITDFSQMQYSLSCRLAYSIKNMNSYFKTNQEFDEKESYLCGWLGKATIKTNYGTTVYNSKDYVATLDAENIYTCFIKNKNKSVLYVMNKYYSSLISYESRASIFKRNIPFFKIKKMIYQELIDNKLSHLIHLSQMNNDYYHLHEYTFLLSDENYHINQIKTFFPNTYNFIRSIQLGLSNLKVFL